MKLTWTEFEIHQIAYLSAKGWKASDPSSDGRGRSYWSFDDPTNSGLEAWYIDIDDAYNEQLRRDEEKNAGREDSGTS